MSEYSWIRDIIILDIVNWLHLYSVCIEPGSLIFYKTRQINNFRKFRLTPTKIKDPEIISYQFSRYLPGRLYS